MRHLPPSQRGLPSDQPQYLLRSFQDPTTNRTLSSRQINIRKVLVTTNNEAPLVQMFKIHITTQSATFQLQHLQRKTIASP